MSDYFSDDEREEASPPKKQSCEFSSEYIWSHFWLKRFVVRERRTTGNHPGNRLNYRARIYDWFMMLLVTLFRPHPFPLRFHSVYIVGGSSPEKCTATGNFIRITTITFHDETSLSFSVKNSRVLGGKAKRRLVSSTLIWKPPKSFLSIPRNSYNMIHAEEAYCSMYLVCNSFLLLLFAVAPLFYSFGQHHLTNQRTTILLTALHWFLQLSYGVWCSFPHTHWIVWMAEWERGRKLPT